MNVPNSSGQYLSGTQNIERGIVDSLKKAGLRIEPQNIRWNGGKEFSPSQSTIELEIAGRGKPVRTVFSREEVVDSWESLNRADVRAHVRAVVAELTADID